MLKNFRRHAVDISSIQRESSNMFTSRHFVQCSKEESPTYIKNMSPMSKQACVEEMDEMFIRKLPARNTFLRVLRPA